MLASSSCLLVDSTGGGESVSMHHPSTVLGKTSGASMSYSLNLTNYITQSHHESLALLSMPNIEQKDSKDISQRAS